LILLTAANAVLVLSGGLRIEQTTDESVNVAKYNTYLSTGWHVVPEQITQDGELLDARNLSTYGPSFHFLSHFVGRITGVEVASAASLEPAGFSIRHLTLGILFTLSLCALGLAFAFATKSAVWATFATAFISSIGALSGSMMFNTKDGPVAVGFIFFMAGILIALSRNERPQRWATVGATICLGFGIFLAVGSRPALVIVFLALMATFLVFSIIHSTSSGTLITDVLSPSFLAVLGSVVGYLALLFLYPKVFADPFLLLSTTFSGNTDFPWGGTTLTNGANVPSQPGWSYLPLWLSVQIPIVTLVLAALGIFVTIRFLFTPKSQGHRQLITRSLAGAGLLCVVLLIGVFLLSTVLGGVLYNGLRQILFVFPAIAILATVGLIAAFNLASIRNPKAGTALLVAAIVFGAAVPTLNALRLFPYNYAAFNVIPAFTGTDGRWETDYWGASLGELSRSAATAQRAGILSEEYSVSPDPCGSAIYRGRWKLPQTGNERDLLKESLYYCQVTTWGRNTPPVGCSTAWSVTRPQFWYRSTMSLVAECPFESPTKTTSELDFSVSALVANATTTPPPNEENLLWGWQVSPDLGTYSINGSAGIGLLLPDKIRPRDTLIELTGRPNVEPGQTVNVEFRINGVVVGQHQYTDTNQPVTVTLAPPRFPPNAGLPNFMILRLDWPASEQRLKPKSVSEATPFFLDRVGVRDQRVTDEA